MLVIIIIGAAMDAMRVDSWKRMMYLMLILGFLGWPSIARLVRGQILSLREQEFMLATEACGIKVWHRIFRHLIPNVIPQLIVTCTMGLGSTILTEATLPSWVWASSTRLPPGATSSTMSTPPTSRRTTSSSGALPVSACCSPFWASTLWATVCAMRLTPR